MAEIIHSTRHQRLLETLAVLLDPAYSSWCSILIRRAVVTLTSVAHRKFSGFAPPQHPYDYYYPVFFLVQE